MGKDMDRIENIMNPPVDYEFTDQDIINEYKTIKDKKKVAAIYGIAVSEVAKILNNAK